MAKGTPSFGKRNKKTHIHCRPLHYNTCGVLGIRDAGRGPTISGTAPALPADSASPAG